MKSFKKGLRSFITFEFLRPRKPVVELNNDDFSDEEVAVNEADLQAEGPAIGQLIRQKNHQDIEEAIRKGTLRVSRRKATIAERVHPYIDYLLLIIELEYLSCCYFKSEICYQILIYFNVTPPHTPFHAELR